MSKNVDMDALATQVASYGFAYLITLGENGRIHTSAVTPVVDGRKLTVAAPSDRVRANTSVRPTISLVWPPAEVEGYSLILDGDAQADAGTLTITPTRAILHRPVPRSGPAADGSSCASDCVEL